MVALRKKSTWYIKLKLHSPLATNSCQLVNWKMRGIEVSPGKWVTPLTSIYPTMLYFNEVGKDLPFFKGVICIPSWVDLGLCNLSHSWEHHWLLLCIWGIPSLVLDLGSSAQMSLNVPIAPDITHELCLLPLLLLLPMLHLSLSTKPLDMVSWWSDISKCKNSRRNRPSSAHSLKLFSDAFLMVPRHQIHPSSRGAK